MQLVKMSQDCYARFWPTDMANMESDSTQALDVQELTSKALGLYHKGTRGLCCPLLSQGQLANVQQPVQDALILEVLPAHCPELHGQVHSCSHRLLVLQQIKDGLCKVLAKGGDVVLVGAARPIFGTHHSRTAARRLQGSPEGDFAKIESLPRQIHVNVGQLRRPPESAVKLEDHKLQGSVLQFAYLDQLHCQFAVSSIKQPHEQNSGSVKDCLLVRGLEEGAPKDCGNALEQSMSYCITFRVAVRGRQVVDTVQQEQ